MPLPARPVAATIDLDAVASNIRDYVKAKRTGVDPDELFAKVAKRVKGHTEAMRAIVDEVCAGLSRSKRTKPIAIIFLVGPPGLGKTHSAHALSHALYGEESLAIEFNHFKGDVQMAKNALFGSPPQYTNADKGGMMVNRLNDKKNGTVICLDEMEKCPKDVQTLLLAALNDGSCTDYFSGKRVSTTNCVFLMTSNVEYERCMSAAVNSTDVSEASSLIKDVVAGSNMFDSAFLDRIGLFVSYRPMDERTLTEFAMDQITEIATDASLTITHVDTDALVQMVGDAIHAEGPRVGPRSMQSVTKRLFGVDARKLQRAGCTTARIVLADGKPVIVADTTGT